MRPWGLRVDYRGCGASLSSAGGSANLTTLGVCATASPSHPPWKSPLYRGGAWLKFGFSILIKCIPSRSEETSHPRSIPNDDPSYRPMKRRGDRPSERHAERPHDRPTERPAGLPTDLQTERSIHRAMVLTTERAADHTPARSTGRSSYGATDGLVDLQS